MDQAISNLIDISATPAALHAAADMTLEAARWAAALFERYDRESTLRIADAVARAAHEAAGTFAERAVAETGFGVVAHKRIKNELASIPLVEHYRDRDFVNPRLDRTRRMVEIPRPAGVIFALVPSTNPISTIYFKVLAALLTRNAIVVSPHPAARECSIDAVRLLAKAAEEAGAPAGVIQVIEQLTFALVEEFMGSAKTSVILATGGSAMVRAAYASSSPAIGVGPGNAPVYVDPSAEMNQAARLIVESKSFDNSVLCTNESVLFALEESRAALLPALQQAGAHVCSEAETEKLRRYLFHERGFNVEALGRDAAWIGQQAGLKLAARVKILVTPIRLIGVDEPLSREKLCPVLGLYLATSPEQALAQARAMLRFSGAGHSAAIHAGDASMIRRFAAAVEAYRVVVNAPCSQGAAGFGTHLAPTFTIGTGFFGRSSIGENIGPEHLVSWTRIAWPLDAELPADVEALTGLDHPGPLSRAPADGVPGMTRARAAAATSTAGDSPPVRDPALREEIRKIIAEELRLALRD
jgi:acyl-CoA reductase-like NAD-dependent aldehyde dehydrogenase